MTELPSTVIVMALRAESAGVFEAAGVPVLYCGVGKVNAAIALSRELMLYEVRGRPAPLVVNFGSAGSRSFATGALVSCHEFVQRDMDVSGLGFALGVTPFEEDSSVLCFDALFTHLPAAVCGSGDSFATAGVDLACAVCDMEAYALAKACRRARAPFACAKYVSDGTDHAAADDWRRNVHKASEEFLNLYRGVVR